MLDHIPGKVNLIPDYLSRGRINEAVTLMKARHGVEPLRIELGAWWGTWLERIDQRLESMKQAEGVWDATALKELMQLDGQVDDVIEEATNGRRSR